MADDNKKEKETAAIEMFVGGLVLDPNTQAPVIVLRDQSNEIHLPIWIGMAEATSIASALKEIEMLRPLTHDLMAVILEELNVSVEQIVITELKESTYYAEMIISVGDRAVVLDCRPSDAIAIALRTESPIYVTERVLKEAHLTIEEAKTAQNQGAEDREANSSSQRDEEMKDFKNIDKDKWKDLLEKLDKDDFKYKV